MPRYSYPHIISFDHPLTDGSRVVPSLLWSRKNPDDRDKAIAAEIMSVHRQLNKIIPANGEWLWINDNKKKNYIGALQREDVAKLAEIFANMFREDAIYGLITSEFSKINGKEKEQAIENEILLDLDVWREFTEQNDANLPLLDMPRVGNPYGLLIDNILISADNPRHDYFTLKLKNLLEDVKHDRPCLLEVGGGYGGLALQVHRRIPSITYIDCDLPESLYLTYYFLRKSTNKRIVWALKDMPKDARNIDVILVPSQHAGIINGPVDIMFNCNSFSEMDRETVNGYMDLLHLLRPLYFLHQNSNFLLFPNSPRHIEILASRFPIDRCLYKEVYRAISPWQGGGGRYREFLYKQK